MQREYFVNCVYAVQAAFATPKTPRARTNANTYLTNRDLGITLSIIEFHRSLLAVLGNRMPNPTPGSKQ
jgi:hypothetical protein